MLLKVIIIYNIQINHGIVYIIVFFNIIVNIVNNIKNMLMVKIFIL